MQLKNSDIKLLNYIYHRGREPITKIAKACKLSREQVDYKLKKYIKLGLIKKFMTLFNYSAFGYNQYIILLIQAQETQNKRKLLDYLKKSKNSIAVGSLIGKYDLYSELIFKNEQEISNFLAGLLEKNKIEEYKIIRPFHAKLYPLKLLENKYAESFVLAPTTNILKEKDIKETDKNLLKIIENNARERIIDIAEKLNISAELVLYKLKKLKENQIILGTRIGFNAEKLGFFYSLILIDIKNFSAEKQEKLKNFASGAKEVNSIILSLEKPNCIIKLFNKTQAELLETIEKIKENIELEDMQIMFGKNEEKLDTLPFLS